MNVPQYLYGSNEELQRYFALLVQLLNTFLSDNGWVPPTLTTAEVNAITSAGFEPVMPPGTFWYNPNIAPNGKLQFITVQAIPAGLPGGPANATIETITSA